MKSEILYGIHSVYEVLVAKRRRVYEIFLEKEKQSKRLTQLVSIASTRGILQKTLTAGELKTMVGAVGHQGVAARVSPFPMTAAADMLPRFQAKDRKHFLLMLDNVLDPQNLGAIIRTALCVGVDGIVLPKDRSASPTPSVSKASAGALEHIRLIGVTNLVKTIKECKNNGLWIYGLQKDAKQSIYASDLTGSIAMVLGGEQKGIRPLVGKNCDFLVSIPQQGPVDSLNASVAAGIAMYESFRQRARS